MAIEVTNLMIEMLENYKEPIQGLDLQEKIQKYFDDMCEIYMKFINFDKYYNEYSYNDKIIILNKLIEKLRLYHIRLNNRIKWFDLFYSKLGGRIKEDLDNIKSRAAGLMKTYAYVKTVDMRVLIGS